MPRKSTQDQLPIVAKCLDALLPRCTKQDLHQYDCEGQQAKALSSIHLEERLQGYQWWILLAGTRFGTVKLPQLDRFVTSKVFAPDIRQTGLTDLNLAANRPP